MKLRKELWICVDLYPYHLPSFICANGKENTLKIAIRKSLRDELTRTSWQGVFRNDCTKAYRYVSLILCYTLINNIVELQQLEQPCVTSVMNSQVTSGFHLRLIYCRDQVNSQVCHSSQVLTGILVRLITAAIQAFTTQVHFIAEILYASLAFQMKNRVFHCGLRLKINQLARYIAW